jgi:hypothetical protein
MLRRWAALLKLEIQEKVDEMLKRVERSTPSMSLKNVILDIDRDSKK